MHLTGNNILAFTKYLLQIVFWPQSTKHRHWYSGTSVPKLWYGICDCPSDFAKENNASYLDIFTFVLTDIPATQIASTFKRWVSRIVLSASTGGRVATSGDGTPVQGIFEGLSCVDADGAVAAICAKVKWAAECRLHNTYAGSLMRISGNESKMKPTFWCAGPFKALPTNSHS